MSHNISVIPSHHDNLQDNPSINESFKIKIISSEAVLFCSKAIMVSVVTQEGTIGILPSHVSTIAKVIDNSTIMIYTQNNTVFNYFIEKEGFIRFHKDECVITGINIEAINI